MRTAILLSAAMLFSIGCGGGEEPNAATVSGVVTLNDQPVTSGMVNFVTGDGSDSFPATIGEDGKYTVNQSASKAGIPPGSYKITVAADSSGDVAPSTEDDKGAKATEGAIPSKYSSVGTSGLTAEVKAGDNDVPLKLSK